MHRIQEVIRLYRLGRSQRTISRLLRMGRDTIRSCLERLADAGLLEGSADELPQIQSLRDALGEMLPPPTTARSSVEDWKPRILELHRKGCGPTAIHDHLRLHVPDYAGSLSAIKRMCRRLTREAGPKETDVVIRVETAPGEIAQVDFGFAGSRYDPQRGVLRRSWLFVMTLAYSREMFCDLVFDQKLGTWLDLHVRAFEHFRGVPRVLIPDNLKAAVVRASFGVDDKAVLNLSYRELARHYNFQIDPTPPRSPEKKGKVESNVKYVSRNFLRTWETVDIEEDRRQLQRWVREIAGQRIHGTTGCRPRESFEEIEAGALSPLPPTRWEPVLWKEVTLHRDCHVQIDGAFYSAPWKLLGRKMWARCTAHSITLWHDNERLHTHGRVSRGKRSTFDEHLPEYRRDLRHRSRSYWVERARELGPEVERLAETIFDSDDVLSQLRRVQAVVSHLEGFPADRARRAAARALHFGSLDYRSLKNILRKGLDLLPLPEESPARAWSRGSRYARQASFFSSRKE